MIDNIKKNNTNNIKTETRHAKNITNAGLLNTYIIQLGTLYKPSNPNLELDKLQAFYNDAFSAQQKINTVLPPYTLTVDNREAVLAPARVFAKAALQFPQIRKKAHNTEFSVADEL
ncbi:MAG: hypothetical protein E2590_13345 [Chryseobacterium sp.]|nr:hypothetical protein [Chryseobacterium sp.]